MDPLVRIRSLYRKPILFAVSASLTVHLLTFVLFELFGSARTAQTTAEPRNVFAANLVMPHQVHAWFANTERTAATRVSDSDVVNPEVPREQAQVSLPDGRPLYNVPPLHSQIPRNTHASTPPGDHLLAEPLREKQAAAFSSVVAAGVLDDAAAIAAFAQQSTRDPIRHGTSPNASARSRTEEMYIEAWTRKVQRIGEQNYPEKAATRSITGELTLRITIDADGNLGDVAVINSSGHEILDSTAKRIVQLASPYAPLPKVLSTDQLVFTQSWSFQNRATFVQ